LLNQHRLLKKEREIAPNPADAKLAREPGTTAVLRLSE
jgi:hypothetical protein